MAASWLLQGAAMGAMLRGLGQDVSMIGHLPWMTATAAMSVVLGFISFFPGGLGAREWAVQLLLRYVGVGAAAGVVAAIAMRLITIVAEVAMAGILYPFDDAAHRSVEEAIDEAEETVEEPPEVELTEAV